MADEEKGDNGLHARLSLTTRMFMVEGDVRNHSRIITALVNDGQQRALEAVRREEQDKSRDSDIKAIKDLIKWAIGGIGIAILAQIGNFIVSGALSVPH